MIVELFIVIYVQWVVVILIMEGYSQQICRMVDIFSTSAKLCIYIPKFYRRFENYILHAADHTFLVACFLCAGSVHHTHFRQFCNLVSTWGPTCWVCLFLKYTLSPIIKEGSCLLMVFWAVWKQFSSNVFLLIAKVSLRASSLIIPESGSSKKCCMGSRSWWRGKFGSLCTLRRIGFLLWLSLVLLYHWQESDWCICPSWMGPSHITSSGWVLDTYGNF